MTRAQGRVSERLPALQPVTSLRVLEGDVLVHAPGFEDRTLGSGGVFGRADGLRCVLLDYRPVDSRNRLSEVRDRFVGMGAVCERDDILEYDRFCPEDYGARLRKRLLVTNARRVTVDISTMSKLAILLTLDVCVELDVDVRIFYAEAATYGPTRQEFERARERNEIHRPTLQVFDGVHGVVRVDSLASVAMQGQPTAAIVFMSFNDALTQVLLNTVYPSRLFLVNEKPPVHSWREAAMAWIHDQVRREWSDDNVVMGEREGVGIPERSVSTLDYRETVALLSDLYWRLSETHRVLLAPAGSKMQAVGCWIVKALHRDIHVEYPSAEGFQSAYSDGVAQRWYLDCGRLAALLRNVGAEERQRYLELGELSAAAHL